MATSSLNNLKPTAAGILGNAGQYKAVLRLLRLAVCRIQLGISNIKFEKVPFSGTYRGWAAANSAQERAPRMDKAPTRLQITSATPQDPTLNKAKYTIAFF